MNVSEITLYNVLRAKLGEQEAQTVVEGIKQEVKNEFDNKKEILATKEGLAEVKSEILRWTFAFVFGALIINIIAIIGAVISIANILKK